MRFSNQKNLVFNKKIKIEPPEKLEVAILARINLFATRIARIKLAVAGLTMSASIVALIYSIQYLSSSLSQSGFYNYIFLIFSDSETMVSVWKNFGISILETLPMTEITIFTALIFVLIYSIKTILGNMNNIRTVSPKILLT